jgi:two-component system, NarL family, invasion response regulator UvrY
MAAVSPAKLKVLIADDHAILRSAIKRLLRDTPDIEVVAEASNAQEVVQRLQSDHWDVLLLDIHMPGQDTFTLLAHVKAKHPDVGVLILSMYPEEQFGVRAFLAGASGYVNKQSTPEDLVAAIRRIRDGGAHISGNIAVTLARNLQTRPVDHTLSDREFTVLCAIAAGKSITAIAKELNLSTKTVSTYRARLLARLHLHSNVELARYALEHGLIS